MRVSCFLTNLASVTNAAFRGDPVLHALLTRLVFRIVEYATRDQAQNAVNTLSNQNLMGRLVYVREVSQTAVSFPRNTNGC